MEIKDVKLLADKIKKNIGKVIVGKEDKIDLILAAMFIGGHVLLRDAPGTGKTKLAKALAGSIASDFGRIQFTPDLLPQDVTGLNIYNQKSGEFEFTAGPVFTNILLADEINRATPRTQSALLECMEEKQVTVDGVTRAVPRPFFIIATENPVETAGTYPLPEAQLDRFTMLLSLGFPGIEEELIIMERFNENDPLVDLSSVCKGEDIIAACEAVKKVRVHESVRRYIAELTYATRTHNALISGVNTRGTLALFNAAKAYAAICGRDFVTPDDVKRLAKPVMCHRIEAYVMSRSQSAETIVNRILESVAVPTEEY